MLKYIFDKILKKFIFNFDQYILIIYYSEIMIVIKIGVFNNYFEHGYE